MILIKVRLRAPDAPAGCGISKADWWRATGKRGMIFSETGRRPGGSPGSFFEEEDKDMILSEKIIQLRKQMGWSQEELAAQLGISRQSVSKWEVGAAIPDLDKILKMSQLFGVSTDYLLKDELEAVEYAGSPDTTGEQCVSAEEASGYMDTVAGGAKHLALAVAGFVVSPVCLIQLCGLAEAGKLSENHAAAAGLLVLMALVAVGVAICIHYGMKVSRYEYLEKESFTLSYGVAGIVEKRKAEFEPVFRFRLVMGVTMIILGVIPLLVAGVLEMSDVVLITCVNLLLVLIAGAVYGFVWTGVIRSSYTSLLQLEDYNRENKRAQKLLEPFDGGYWLLATALYLGISFCTGAWDRTWIVWPVAGVLFAALHTILQGILSGRKDG